MKVSKILFGGLLLALVASASLVVSQEKTSAAYKYDSANQQTVRGWVEESRDFQCPVSGAMGSHITVKSEMSSVEVHLAPASFMKQYEINIRKNDKVTVVGSKITFEGKPAIMARTLTIGRDTYNFRDADGKPLW